MVEKGQPLPKFDVNDPASAEGFTVIFNKARNEKKTLQEKIMLDTKLALPLLESLSLKNGFAAYRLPQKNEVALAM